MYVESVAIHPDAQGRGLGRALMSFAEQEAARRGLTRMALVTHEVMTENAHTVLRLRMPFAQRGEVGLKKVGSELVVTVGHEKRTIILPSALARRHPTGARLERGSLEVSFEDGRSPRAEQHSGARDAGRAAEPA